MNRQEFETRLRQLQDKARADVANTGCVGCEKCVSCADCTFCVGSKGLRRSSYCHECVDCTDASHCHRSQRLTACSHVVDSSDCQRSHYIVRSSNLADCNYCFGCVGLSKKDFHILNEPYDRSRYFETVAKLTRELGIKEKM